MLRRFSPPDPREAALTVVLHPRPAPTGKLRVWAGVFDPDLGSQSLGWKLDGRAVSPKPLHPRAAGTGADLAPAHAHGARAFTGVYELDAAHGVVPGRRHRLQLSVGGTAPATLELETLPSRIPDPMDGELRLLLASCFHRAEDPDGAAGSTVLRLPETERPHLTLLMGDQVYLDLPTIADFPDDEAALARRFERDYRLNWAMPSGYSQVLAAAPSVSSPDDHEYWNNFPHRAPIIQNSWSQGGRERWTAAARQLYSAFQQPHPAAIGEPVEIDVPPLSIVVLDQRSERRNDVSASLAPGALAKISAWVDRVLEEKGFPAVVTGQSLFDAPTGKLEGKLADRVLADYGDYRALMRELERLADGGRPVLLLTGDVHWGRVTEIRRHGRLRFYEIICSPSSLVSSVGIDQVKILGVKLGGLFGEADSWPRHGDPDVELPARIRAVLGHGYTAHVVGEQKGNQVAMLALRRTGGGLSLRVTYHSTRAADPPNRIRALPLPSHQLSPS